MKNLIWVAWPSFVVAGIGEILFFTLISPKELYLFGDVVHYSALTTYSLGFFAFWILCAASSLFTCFLQRSPREVNSEPLVVCGNPGK